MPAQQRAPLLSFLTTAYRTEDYLPATLDSVLAQDHDGWEVVVVDNGNDDAIADIVRSYAARDDRVRLVRQDNRGYVGGLTAAADVARGSLLVPLDSDDQVEPGFVSRVADFFAEHPDADALGCDAHLFTDERDRPHGRGYLRSVGIKVPSRRGDRLTLGDVLAGRVPYYGAAIRRTAWDAVGGYQASPPDVDESVDVWLRLASRFTIYMIPDRLARYRVRTDSISRHPQSVERFEVELVNTFLQHADDAERGVTAAGGGAGGGAAGSTVRNLRYHQALRRARWALSRGDVPEAREQTRAAFAQRRTLRVALILVLLRVAPGLLVRLHPLKQHLERWLSDHAPQRGWRSRRARPVDVVGTTDAAAPTDRVSRPAEPGAGQERSAPAGPPGATTGRPRGRPPTSA